MQNRMWANAYRTTVVCVDAYDEGVPKGRLYNPYLPDGESFRNLMDFLLKMEALLDGMNFPQPFEQVRVFSRKTASSASSPPKVEKHEGKRATFALRVLFRQNASWQGSVTWLEGGQEESFRSVLELLMLMNSALTEEENNGKRPAASASCGA